MPADLSPVSLEPLTPAERRDLLLLARTSIRCALDLDVLLPEITLTLALLEPTAAFVSLHIEGRLRGCVGSVTPDNPLHETVAHMARSAALDDPRFPALTPDEVAFIDVEISRLSRMMAARPDDVRPGIHGVCISSGTHRAVFLPQVATTYGWDRDTLLDELCLKAFLPARAWRQAECEILVFVAEVFGEIREARMVNDCE